MLEGSYFVEVYDGNQCYWSELIIIDGVDEYYMSSVVTSPPCDQEGLGEIAVDVFGVVESVKAASDLYMPVSGEITEINESLNDSPELINDDPYEKGWVIRVKISEDDLSSLLSPEEYLKTIGTSS